MASTGDMHTLSVEVASVKHHVQLSGPAGAPLVVLAHALMSSLHIYDSTVKTLNAAGYRTLAYDQVGHGRTSAPSPSTHLSFDDLTRNLHDIILQATQATPSKLYAIIGTSMGAVIAVRYSLLYPDSSLQRVVCADAPGLTSLKTSKETWAPRVDEFRNEGVEGLAQKTAARWFPEPCPAGARDKALEITRTCSFEGYRLCAEGISSYDYEPLLHQVKVRTLIVRGEVDSAVGPEEILQSVAQKIAGARYVRLKACGHIPPMHVPDEFERLVLDFLQ